MGAQNSPILPAMARVVDYARSPFKSPALDIHLIRHAKYFIGTTSGLLNVAISLGLPAAVVNALTTESQLWHSAVRFTPKRIRTAQGRDLTWRELTSTPGRWGLFTVETMKRAKFTSIENTPDEILGAVVEAEAVANGQSSALSPTDEALLARWHKSVNPPHNYGGALPSVQFLRKYPDLLDR
jgi:putative glycosyltransferase (TIGR04372 family)